MFSGRILVECWVEGSVVDVELGSWVIKLIYLMVKTWHVRWFEMF
jgi:hypothetical protein